MKKKKDNSLNKWVVILFKSCCVLFGLLAIVDMSLLLRLDNIVGTNLLTLILLVSEGVTILGFLIIIMLGARIFNEIRQK